MNPILDVRLFRTYAGTETVREWLKATASGKYPTST